MALSLRGERLVALVLKPTAVALFSLFLAVLGRCESWGY